MKRFLAIAGVVLAVVVGVGVLVYAVTGLGWFLASLPPKVAVLIVAVGVGALLLWAIATGDR